MKSPNLLALLTLPFVVIVLAASQDCGTLPPVVQPYVNELARFLEAVALLPRDVVPPPWWQIPRDGSQVAGPTVSAWGYSIRGQDRPGLNPSGTPAVVEIHQMVADADPPVSRFKIQDAVVSSDYIWQAQPSLLAGRNTLGARTRVGGHVSEFAVLTVTTQHGVPPPPPGSAGLTPDEEAFVQALRAEVGRIPIRQEQRLGNFLVDPSGRGTVWGGLHAVFAELCIGRLAGQGRRDEEILTFCGASNLAAGEFLGRAFNALFSGMASAFLTAYFEPYTLTGKFVLNSVKVVVDLAFGEEPGPTLVRSLATRVAGSAYRRGVGKYVADPLAKLTVYELQEHLKRDVQVADDVTKTVWVKAEQTNVRVALAFTYNPWTHYATAYVSSDKTPGSLYIVLARLDRNGLPVREEQPRVIECTRRECL